MIIIITIGESVIAIIVLRNINSDSYELTSNNNNNTKVLKQFLNDKLAHYKHPRHTVVVFEIPRNHMGKVNKKTLLKDLNISL